MRKLFLLTTTLAAGHVLERRLYIFLQAVKARHMMLEEERALARSAMYMEAMQEGYEIWLKTDEAQELIRQQREEMDNLRRAAEEQAWTS